MKSLIDWLQLQPKELYVYIGLGTLALLYLTWVFYTKVKTPTPTASSSGSSSGTTTTPATPATSPSATSAQAGNNPAPAKRSWGEVRENNLVVGLLSIAMIAGVVYFIFPGFYMDQWINHRSTVWVAVILIVGSFILPAFKPAPQKTAWRAWMLCLAMLVLFGFNIDWVDTAGGAMNTIVESQQEKSDEPVVFVAEPSKWSRWQTISSRHGWSASAEGKEGGIVEIQEEGRQPFAYNEKNGDNAHMVGGIPFRLRSLEKGKVTVTFRPK